MGRTGLLPSISMVFAACLLWTSLAAAQPAIEFDVAGADPELTSELRAASLVVGAVAQDDAATAADLVSAALADYRRLVETLYANGYYSGVVRIRVNGREAADLPLLALPSQIDRIDISVDPGRPFTFGRVAVGPLAPSQTPPEGLVSGALARAKVLRAATGEVVDAWRDAGHAKARPGDQRITANHAQATLSADIRILPGPKVSFGNLVITSDSAVRQARIRRIAGLPTGAQFSPETMDKVANRLRRTGTFSSVTLDEGAVRPDGTMDVELAVVDRLPRRFGFGAELSSREGLDISAFWLHRNLFGGAERLRIEAEIGQIAAQNDDPDYTLGARLDIPAVLGPDTSQFFKFQLESLDEPLFRSDTLEIGGGITWFFREDIEAEFGVSYLRSKTRFALGEVDYNLLTFPATFTRDRRNDPLNATDGTYLRLEATPYLGLSGSESGARLYADARGYQQLGSGRFVFAARFQVGAIFGSSLIGTYPDYLFYSGGGGTVRGQPYQSLDVDLAPNLATGGRSFFGSQLELRAGLTDALGAVVFADAGYIGSDSLFDSSGDWHGGAGFGLRYDTGIGPIRLDIAGPVGGDTGDGVQIYIGIGQAF